MIVTELLAQITDSLVEGNPDATLDLTRQALAAGAEPLKIIDDGLLPGMKIVGDKYSAGEFFLPNLIVAAAAMKQAMATLAPELERRRQQLKSLGKVVIGTVRGDIHEIGKSLVATMLAANGFEVHDLGVDVPTEKFVEAVRGLRPDLVGLSALLTTTMSGQKTVIEALRAAGLRDEVRVIVGGAPVTERWATEIGADGHAPDAVTAVALATRLAAV